MTKTKCEENAETIAPLQHPVQLGRLDDQGSSIYDCSQCQAITSMNRRCDFRNCYTFPFCKWHLDSLCGLRIGESSIPDAGLGLFTTIERKTNDFITFYSGDVLTDFELNVRYHRDRNSPERPIQSRYIYQLTSQAGQVSAQEGSREVTKEERTDVPTEQQQQSILFKPVYNVDAIHSQTHTGRYMNNVAGRTNAKFVAYAYRPESDASQNFLVKVVASTRIVPGAEVIVGYGPGFNKPPTKQQHLTERQSKAQTKDWTEEVNRILTAKYQVKNKVAKLTQTLHDAEVENQRHNAQRTNIIERVNPIRYQGRIVYAQDPQEIENLLDIDEYKKTILTQRLSELQQETPTSSIPSRPL